MAYNVYTKPVLLARFPLEMKEKAASFYEHLNDKLSQDYHVLAIIENSSTEMRLEIFNSVGADVLELEKLKLEITESFKTFS